MVYLSLFTVSFDAVKCLFGLYVWSALNYIAQEQMNSQALVILMPQFPEYGRHVPLCLFSPL